MQNESSSNDIGAVHFEIHSSHKGKSEIIDSDNLLSEATILLAEYRLAFGPDWKLWIVSCDGIESRILDL
jgi:hypothetical protein